MFFQPLNLDHYDKIRTMSEEIRSIAPDARVMTTYYCGKNHLVLATNMEVFKEIQL